MLDLVTDIDFVHLPRTDEAEHKTVLSQPGMRYALAEALVNSLLMDKKFGNMDISHRSRVLDRLLDTVRGVIMEEIVLLETKIALPKQTVCKVQFAIGEFDMVVHDKDSLTCKIYEIKHSREIVPEQYRHLADEQNCALTEHSFGKITNKYVIYRGDSTIVGDIQYLNVEEYLKTL